MRVIRPVEHADIAALVRADPQTSRLVLTAAQLDALKCRAGDHVRLVRLCAEEKTV